MRFVLTILISVFSVTSAFAQDVRKPPSAAVVSAHPKATQAGLDILANGGNAYDAAIAVSAMLGVVEPYSAGLGGGGFWLLYDAKSNAYSVLDARETAPLAATANMYLDAQGNIIKGASMKGPLSAGIPGLPAAFVELDKSGNLTLEEILTPAIDAAQKGFPVDARYVNGVRVKKDFLLENQEAASIFLDNGNVPEQGWLLKQPDLAQTLRLIAKDGHAGFYNGPVAEKMVTDVKAHGGIWALEDFKSYKIIKRDPMVFNYKNAKIIAPPLPSSGGVVLHNIFNILSGYDLSTYSGVDQKHLNIEAMRHAYFHRVFMGDSDFVDVPVEKITSNEMAQVQRSKIDLDRALPSATLMEVTAENKGADTTHFSVIDKDGNRVAVTQSINFWFGSGFVPKGTGVLLNNEMDDFTIKTGAANGYGLVGTKANAVAPGKRMLSSMTPTFVENDRGMMMIGTPGGSRIISMNLLGILGFLEGKSAKEINAMKRYHHQFMPDEAVYEGGALSREEEQALEAKGHILKKSNRDYGNMQIIIWDYENNTLDTASDPRGEGAGRVY